MSERDFVTFRIWQDGQAVWKASGERSFVEREADRAASLYVAGSKLAVQERVGKRYRIRYIAAPAKGERHE